MKDHPVPVRFTEEQYAWLCEQRERYGVPLSESIRRAVQAAMERQHEIENSEMEWARL